MNQIISNHHAGKSMFGNKHVMIAMIVAPILAIISYFATDYFVADAPVAAEEGGAYSLLARPNCRYDSGQCTLKNGDLEIHLRKHQGDDGVYRLEVKSNQPLEGLKASLLTEGQKTEAAPEIFSMLESSGKSWALALTNETANAAQIRLATQVGGTVFYASTGTAFFEFDTSFPRKNW